MNTLWQDLRYGLRQFRASRGVTGVALLALALGIGANSALFSVVEAVLLRALPYRDADRLVMVWDQNLARGLRETLVSAPNFVDYRAQNTVFEDLAAFDLVHFVLTGGGEPERLRGLRVTAGWLPLLGVQPALGRAFSAEEMRPGGPDVVLVSHGLWQRRFGGNAALLGRPLTLDGKSYTVIGVMPPGFAFPDRRYDVWAPLLLTAPAHTWRGYHHLGVAGRLKPGVTLPQAAAQLNGIAARLGQQYPASNRGWGVLLVRLRDQQVREVRPALLVLLGVVGFVLLIACASIANLLLARNAAREREIAVRTALGAGRARLLRQLLTESVLLALLGGLLGLALTPAITRLLLSFRAQDVDLPQRIDLHTGVLAFTLALCLLTGLVFGLIPALQGSRTDLVEALKEGGRSGGEGFRRHRLRAALVVVEVALALLLLLGAGLMIRSFLRLGQVQAGFQPDHLLTMRLALPDSRYGEASRRAGFYRAVLARIAALPGVEAAGATNCLPLVSDFPRQFRIHGRPEPAPGEALSASFRAVTPDYLRAMRIALRRGRAFSEQDHAEALPVALINEELARRHFPSQDPLGQRIHLGVQDVLGWRVIVGVVGDVRHRALDAPIPAELYVPYYQWPQALTTLVTRTAGDPAAMTAAVRAQVRAVDPDQPVAEVRTMEQVVAESVAPRRAVLTLLGGFAALALILAALGVYGVISFSVAERTQEIGVRMALGAQPRQVLRMVLAQGLRLALAGVTVGALAALALTRVLASLLFGVTATDPATFAAVPLFLIAVVLLAAWLPARRATRLDPMAALRVQ